MGYPPALYDAIHARLGGDAGAVLEIGPGTGLATRDIMARLHPSRLVAVEADARLAAHLEARLADPRVAVEIGRPHLLTPVTNAPLVCHLLLEKKKTI